MWSLYLVVLCVSLAPSSASSLIISDTDVNNLLAVGDNAEPPLSFIEHYNAKTNTWKALATTNFNITEYGVALYKNRLLLIGGRRHSDGSVTDEVNEVDLLSGEIKTVDYMKLTQPRRKLSAVVDGEGKSSVLYIMGGLTQSGSVSSAFEKWDESTQKWTNLTKMTYQREGASVVAHNGAIYAVGGFSGSQYRASHEVYNISGDVWTEKRYLSGIRGNLHGVSDGRYIYVVGGFTNYSDPDSALDLVQRYDPENDEWISLANINHCLGSVGVNLLNGQLYAVGGTNCVRTQIYHQNNDTWQYLDSLTYDRSSHTVVKVPFDLKDYDFNWIPGNRSMKNFLIFDKDFTKTRFEVFHPEDDYWQEINNLVTYNETLKCVAAFVNDRLIIVGGVDHEDNIVDKVYELSLDTGESIQLSSMKDAKIYAPLVTVGEGKSARLYIIGGFGPYEDFANIDRWDPFTDTWEILSPMSYKLYGVAAASHQGNIYAIGGANYDEDFYHNQNEVYLVDEDRWESRAPIKYNLTFCSAVSDGKYIYVAGGIFYDGQKSNHFQRYDPSSDTWTELAETSSSHHVGISLLDNVPILFGGRLIAGGNSDVTEIYDAEKDEWRRLASLPNKGQLINALQMPWKYKYSF